MPLRQKAPERGAKGRRRVLSGQPAYARGRHKNQPGAFRQSEAASSSSAGDFCHGGHLPSVSPSCPRGPCGLCGGQTRAFAGLLQSTEAKLGNLASHVTRKLEDPRLRHTRHGPRTPYLWSYTSSRMMTPRLGSSSSCSGRGPRGAGNRSSGSSRRGRFSSRRLRSFSSR
jgi:hypothetical protein